MSPMHGMASELGVGDAGSGVSMGSSWTGEAGGLVLGLKVKYSTPCGYCRDLC